MTRILHPELLDTLPADNPGAKQSRADLRRVNAWMGHRRILVHALQTTPLTNVRRIVELGAGDGTLSLALATKFNTGGTQVELTLVDQQKLVTPGTQESFRSLGWQPRVVQADVFDWLAAAAEPADIIFANLFLHHFDEPSLRRLLHAAAERCSCFVALEPRRHPAARLGCEFLWLIGCNHITRHDARLSVRAGFRDRELSSLWPRGGAPVSDPASSGIDQETRGIGDQRSKAKDWQLHEKTAEIFSHLFVATRTRA